MSNTQPKVGDVWYRYNDPIYDVELSLEEYRVVKVTPCGVRLVSHRWYSAQTKLVLLNSHKQFACPTKADALHSFMHRKTRQIAILTAQLRRAQNALAVGKALELCK